MDPDPEDDGLLLFLEAFFGGDFALELLVLLLEPFLSGDLERRPLFWASFLSGSSDFWCFLLFSFFLGERRGLLEGLFRSLEVDFRGVFDDDPWDLRELKEADVRIFDTGSKFPSLYLSRSS